MARPAALVTEHWHREVALKAATLRYREEFLERATSPAPAVRGAFFAVDSIMRGLEGR